MVQFTSKSLSDAITRIRDGSDVCMYLVEGEKRAALIDTGYGLGKLKEYVEKLTDKPYDVFLTHGHLDHVGGSGGFPSVHINSKDQKLVERSSNMTYREEHLSKGYPLFYSTLSEDDFVPQGKPEIIPLEDGQRTELGGITIRWIAVPGHTKGSMVALIEEERMIMFGDACGVGVLLILEESTTVTEYYHSLRRLQKWEGMYDRVLRQHGTCESTPHVLEDNIEACERIMNQTDDAVICEFGGRTCWKAIAFDPLTGARLDGREGNIYYDKKRI